MLVWKAMLWTEGAEGSKGAQLEEASIPAVSVAFGSASSSEWRCLMF